MIRDLIREAYSAMQHNRRRTMLTMLGMAWGIATVVMLLSYGNGFGVACANVFANFGTKLMIIVPGRSSMQAGGQKAVFRVGGHEQRVDPGQPHLTSILQAKAARIDHGRDAARALRSERARLGRCGSCGHDRGPEEVERITIRRRSVTVT